MRRYFFLVLLFFFPLSGQEVQYLQLEGHLSKERLEESIAVVKKMGSAETLALVINSASGDLTALLNLAKDIYEFKVEKGGQVAVYIADRALGPAAMLPFLANELSISSFVSWGDIPLGSHEEIPIHILRNQVVSLVSADDPHASELKMIAAAMSDKELMLVDIGGKIKLAEKEESDESILSRKGETLVLNHNQIKNLGLVEASRSLESFQASYVLTPPSGEQLQEIKDALALPPKTFDEKLKKHIRFNESGNNMIGRILIEDRTSGISHSTWLYVKSALDSYKKLKPAFVILELNTPGGEVFSSQEISDALKDLDINSNIPVVAYINNWAISAGAMLAYSSRFITVVKDGSMGAAEPVLAGEGGQMKAASEKVNSALRTDFANRARFFDRNPDIAEAMVDKDIILVFRHGKIIRLNDEAKIQSTGPNPDLVISSKGKLLTLNAQQLVDYGVADTMILPERLESITAEEKAAGRWPLSKMLLGKYPFFENIPNAIVVTYKPDWRTQFFIFLATPLVSSLLMLGLLLGLYLEINTPGIGLPGAVAVSCLALIVISNLSLEIASWLEVIFLLAGVVLILMDLFLIPTGGILLFIGAIFFIGGLFAIMLPGIGSVNYEFDTQTFNAAGELFFKRLAWLCATFVVAVVIMFLLTRWIKPSFVGFSRVVLMGHEQDASAGYIAGERPEDLPQKGSKGEVLATLRPSGKIIVDGNIFEAVTNGAFIEKGAIVVVEKLDGSVIVVARESELT